MTGRRLDPPAKWDAARRDIWNDTVDRLTATGRIFTTDYQVLVTYVEAVRSHAQASEILAQSSVMIIRGDRAMENPALAIQRRTAADVARISKALGLDRNPVGAVVPPDPMGGARWCDRHSRLECTHHRVRCEHPSGAAVPDGGCCHEQVVKGTPACQHHAGKSLAVAKRDGQVALARVYGARREVSPAEGLLELVQWSAGHADALRRQVAALETAETGSDGIIPGQNGTGGGLGGGLWGGTTKVVIRDGVVEEERRAAKHVIVQAYDEERRLYLDACRAATTAGAQQQMADVAAALGTGLGRLIEAILGRLELTEHQRALVPVVVPQVLRDYSPTGTPP
jgi:P27 family predicted phage terminase small subunit